MATEKAMTLIVAARSRDAAVKNGCTINTATPISAPYVRAF
jgi:hypothetical protein